LPGNCGKFPENPGNFLGNFPGNSREIKFDNPIFWLIFVS
jgi:hypothetical protein